MAAMLLSACSKEEQSVEKGQNLDGTFTFNLVLDVPDDEKADGAAAKAATRATVTMARYLLEMYEVDVTATPIRMTSIDGTFNVSMKKGVDYVCLFWADGGEADYTATDLKAVTQTTPTDVGKPAYYATVTTNTNNFNGSVTLKRAVAEVRYVEAEGFTTTDNTLTVKYPIGGASFNVADGTVANFGTGAEVVRSFTNITATAADATLATDYLLAPAEQKFMSGIKFQFNTEPEKTIAMAPLQANFKTNLKGAYGYVLYVSNEQEFAAEWEKAKVSGGDFIVTLANNLTLSAESYETSEIAGAVIINGKHTLTIDIGIGISTPVIFNCKVVATEYGSLAVSSGGSYTPKSAAEFTCPVKYWVESEAEFLQAMNDQNSVYIEVENYITLTSTGNLTNTDVSIFMSVNTSLTIPTATTLSVGELELYTQSTFIGGTTNVSGNLKFYNRSAISANTTINCTSITTDGNIESITNNGTITYLNDVDKPTLALFTPNQPTKR